MIPLRLHSTVSVLNRDVTHAVEIFDYMLEPQLTIALYQAMPRRSQPDECPFYRTFGRTGQDSKQSSRLQRTSWEGMRAVGMLRDRIVAAAARTLILYVWYRQNGGDIVMDFWGILHENSGAEFRGRRLQNGSESVIKLCPLCTQHISSNLSPMI